MSAPGRKRLSRYWLLPLLVVLGGGAALAVRSRPVVLAAVPVEVGPVAREARGTGTIEAESQVSVAFTIAGRVARVSVEEGQRVREGDVLAVLDPEEQDRHLASARRSVELATTSLERAQADIERARITLDAAERERKRAETLFAAGVISEAARDEAVERAERALAEHKAAVAARHQGAGAVAVARATAAVQAQRTAEAEVRSPVDGVVVRKLHEPGDVVAPGTQVLVIASTRKIWARTWVDETAIHELREGQPARVLLRGAPSRAYPAEVDRVAVEADRQTHEVLVDLRLRELPERLVLGQRADGFITLQAVPSSLRIPAGACDVGRAECPVERDGEVAYVGVQLGVQGDDWIEVSSGLSRGDWVLLPGPGGEAPPPGRRVRRRAP